MEQNKIKDYLKKIQELDNQINDLEDDDIDESVDDIINNISKINEVLTGLDSELKPKIDIEFLTNQLFDQLFGQLSVMNVTENDKKAVIRTVITSIVNQM